MNRSLSLLSGFLIVLLLGFGLCTFTVQQGSEALKFRLGELQVNKNNEPVIYSPGLHFKFPIVNSIRYIDMRLQDLSADSASIITKGQKTITVDYFAKWRVSDLPLYFRSTGGNYNRAVGLLTKNINSVLLREIGKRTLADVVANDRATIMKVLREQSGLTVMKLLGVKIVDVRIRRVELPQQVNEAVYTRMRTQREQVATQYRSQGQAKNESIKADTDATVQIKLATAEAQAQAIRAAGDKEAAMIYLNAYNKDPNFYAFYRSLGAYQAVFHDKNDVMVLKPNSEFFKFFNMNKLTQKH